VTGVRAYRSAVAVGVVDNVTPGLARSWFAVALSTEVGDGPVAVSVLGVPWVLARLDGRLVAFEDRCPHRLAPLSIGTVCAASATLQCRYHGWRYDADGRCVEIPSLGPDAAIPPRAQLRGAAGVAERYGLVWLAPEDPVAPIPDFHEWDDPGFATHWNEPRRTPASAVQLCENFLDASHLPTVHTTTIGVADAGYLPPVTVEVDGHRAWTTYQVSYANHADPLVATGEHPLEQPQVLYKELAPATTVVMRLGFPLTGRTLAILFSCLPETATSTRVFKMMARDDVAPGAPELAGIEVFQDRVLDEDLAVLEPFARHEVPLDLRAEVHVRADQLALAYRRVLARMADGT
jgi:vanillate O-demethylase monooxygenase subunit